MEHVPIDFTDDAQSVMMDAFSRIVQMEEGATAAMPMKFVCVVEYQTIEGNTYCMRFGDKDSAGWDRMGLLQFGLMCEARFLAGG